MDPNTSEVDWHQLADAVSLGLVLIGPDARVLHWNAWVERYSGVPMARAAGRRLEDIFPGALPLSFRNALKKALAHRLPVMLSNVLHHSPMPLYSRPEHADEDVRMPQSVLITPIARGDAPHLCLIQITDTSVLAKRERVLLSRSDRISREALVDGLTGVYNRKYFDQKLQMELERAQRSMAPLSLVMIDVDCFKNFNDTYGHPAGDRVLVAVADCVRRQVNRATDVMARYGGEEFAVVLPSSDKLGAQLIAEKMRQAVAAMAIPHSASLVAQTVTISLGVACHDPHGSVCTATELLELADKALYGAKRAGRNVVRWMASGATPLDGTVVSGGGLN